MSEIEIHNFLTPELLAIKDKFAAENFDIEGINDPETIAEIAEWYWKEPDVYVFAYFAGELVGMASLSKREVQFQGKPLRIAGFGGLTVAKQHRGKGIAKQLLAERFKLAKEWGADIAFLNTDINKLGQLFSKFGFVPLDRNYSFIGKSGAIHEDGSGMIAPVNSEEKFQAVLNDRQAFFVGESNM